MHLSAANDLDCQWPDSSSSLLFSCNPLLLGNVDQIICTYPTPPPPSKVLCGRLAPSSRCGCALKQKPPSVSWGEMEQGWGGCIISFTLYQNELNWKGLLCNTDDLRYFEISSLLLQFCYMMSALEILCSWLRMGSKCFKRWFFWNRVINIDIFEAPDTLCLGRNHIYSAVITTNTTCHKHGFLS